MSSSSKLVCSALACAVLSNCAIAQSAPAPEPVLPATKSTPATVKAPPVGFQSVFSRYRPYRPIERPAWRDINDQVAAIGGWRAYARQASAAEEPPESPKSSDSASGTAPPAGTHEHASHDGARK